jgi:hypothetical protein
MLWDDALIEVSDKKNCHSHLRCDFMKTVDVDVWNVGDIFLKTKEDLQCLRARITLPAGASKSTRS